MKSCLIVDDVEVTRYIAQQYVSALGWETVVATTADEAMRNIREKTFDVVLLDWHLREETGPSMIPKIKEIAPNIKIVVFSGVEGEEMKKEALKLGANAFLAKPTTKDKIQKAFQDIGVV